MGACIQKPAGSGEARGASNQTADERTLPDGWRSQYTAYEVLGKGMSGKVYRVNADLAVKIMPLSADLLPEEIEDMRRECRILKGVQHPHILAYEKHEEWNKCLYLLTELLRGAELFDYITSRTEFKEDDARAVTRVLLDVLKYLHAQNIAHRDLKPENIILAKTEDPSSVKIVDFGLACKVPNKLTGITKAAGTPGYLPPEALVRNADYGLPSDVWAVGVITYILLCGYPPFYGETDVDLFRDIRRAKVEFDMEDWGHTSTLCRDFIKKIFQKDPAKRPTVVDLLEHPWIKGEEKIPDVHMEHTVQKLKEYRAKKRFKMAGSAIIFANRCKKLNDIIQQSLDPVGFPLPAKGQTKPAS